MQDSQRPSGQAQATAVKGSAALDNPAFRMMGLPRLRAKLPSRNWTIFLTIVGSFSAAVIYDRRERRKAQQKWCNAVSHLSEEVLPTSRLPRKLTVYLVAPPGDGLRTAREHFQEYVRPMLVAAAVDWDVVEGRKEGELRATVAERIRQDRRKRGELSETVQEEDVLTDIREKSDITAVSLGGEIIIGRHTWKEYIRGQHEGWLGPLDAPKEAETEDMVEFKDPSLETSASDAGGVPSTDSALPSTPDVGISSPADGRSRTLGPADDTSPIPVAETYDSVQEQKPKPKPSPTPPYILPNAYQDASLAQTTPSEYTATVLLPLPHLLGFLNTPIRIYRFLNRRYLAQDTGKLVSSLLLSDAPNETYEHPDNVIDTLVLSYEGDPDQASWEQQRLLLSEERDWHKVAHKPSPPEDADKERPWIEPMTIDFRIGSRMRKRQPLLDPASSGGRAVDGDISATGKDDGTEVRGNSVEWKGGALRPERTSWAAWLREAFGLDTHQPACKGWEHGQIGDES